MTTGSRLLVVFAIITGIAGLEVEHCNVVNETIVKKGVVNLVYSMDRQCVTCYREANNLVTLRAQLAKFGINVNAFIAINELTASQTGPKLSEQLEINVDQMWNTFGAKNGHIFVLDRCGKMTYQVISPWSKQIYPFTAMSVLSALFDNPCGECNITTPIHRDLISSNSFLGAQRAESGEETDENLENMLVKDSPIPLTIVYREKHYHQRGDEQVEYNLVELRSKDPHYHGHGDDAAGQEAGNNTETSIIDGSTSESDTTTARAPQPSNPTVPWMNPVDVDATQNGGNRGKPYDEVATKKLLKHYEPLMKWLHCAKYVMGKTNGCSQKQ